MRSTLLFLITATFAAGAPKPGDAGTPEYDQATALVKQLGHPRFASREMAAKQILDMGGAAVPALLAGIKSDDEENPHSFNSSAASGEGRRLAAPG